jgi:LmbE family N-acetylglucosaminyl deacetylase
MLDLILDSARRRALRVLCAGAHCDDIEIGCAGTLLALQARRRRVVVDWVVFSGDAKRRAETALAMRMLVRPASRGRLLFGGFADGRFPAAYGEVKDFCERLKRRPAPDLILCHERDDRHQDHRVVNEVIWNTFRDHVVLEYEIPKWDGGLGQPNVYVPVSAAQARAKVNALLKAYGTQKARSWFTRDTFMAMLRLRGVECRSPTGYAEAFHGRKLRFRGG